MAATGHPRAIALALEGLAGAVLLTGDARWAGQLLGCGNGIRASAGAERTPTEQRDVERIELAAIGQIGSDAFASAFDEGRRAPAQALIAAPVDA